MLSAMINQAIFVGMVEGFEVGLGQDLVSHLQLVDDMLIFCANSRRQIKFLRCTLRCFEGVTGLKVNFGKSA